MAVRQDTGSNQHTVIRHHTSLLFRVKRQCHLQRVLSRTITTLFCLLVGRECGVGRCGNCLICGTFEKFSLFPHKMSKLWPDLSVEISTLNCKRTSMYQKSAQNKFKAVIVISVDMLTITSFRAVE